MILMKELKLRKDYPKWNWTDNSERQQAYHALVYKENTALFAKTVWNEMVDCLYNALTEVGLEWNDTVASYENTKFSTFFLIDWLPMNFTARRFNAVRFNIQNLINSTFIWQYDNDYEGYVGRNDYRGVSDTTEPDTLYGSALIELARKINVLIDILKDEANNQDGIADIESVQSTDSLLSVPELSALQSDITNKIESSSNITNLTAKGLNTDASFDSAINGNLQLRNADSSFMVNENSMTIFDAIITLEDLYKNLYSTIFHYMMINAKMTINYNSVKVTAEVPNILLETSNMSFADIVSIISSSVSNSYSDAALNNSNPLRINVDHISRAVAEALVSVKNKRLIRLIVNYETSVTAQIENFKGSSFISIVANVLSISSNLNKAICRRANSQVSCRATISMPDLIRNIANPMISELIDCVGNIQSEMEKGIVLHADSFTENLMQQESVMIKSEIAKMQSRVEMTSDNEADVEKLLIRLLSFTETYKAEIESSMASLNSMIQESDISSIFTDDLRLEIYSAGESMGVRETFILNNESRLEALNYGEDYLKTRTVYQTFFDSELASVEPYLVNIEEIFVDTCDAIIETLDAEQTLNINANAFNTISNTNISIVNLEPLIGTIEHDALLFADITFDPSSWHNPVQINDVLEIYQVYEGEQNGMNLNLG